MTISSVITATLFVAFIFFLVGIGIRYFIDYQRSVSSAEEDDRFLVVFETTEANGVKHYQRIELDMDDELSMDIFLDTMAAPRMVKQIQTIAKRPVNAGVRDRLVRSA